MDTKLICLSFLFGLVSLVSFGQTFPVSEMEEGYYVVIGVYNGPHGELAANYAKSKEAETGFHTAKNRYYVYSLFTANYRDAISGMKEARKDIHPDAWVFVCPAPATRVELAKNSPDNTEKEEDWPSKSDEQPQIILTSQKETSGPATALENETAEERNTEPLSISELDVRTNLGTHVAFLLSNARNNKEVRGEVQIVDTERAQLNDVIASGEVVELKNPENGTGRITAIAEVFGYRKQQMEMEYNRLFDHENVNKVSDYYVIFMDLIRYHKGDIATMYNVYFFNDAAVMRPESKYEVNSLLAMMQENPDYKIRIHGHTNGRRSGKIIRRTKNDPFYALADSNKDSFGSARALSRERASVIRDYLISEGIDPDRMEIKAWGGSRMLYDKNSSQAKKNVRVEIEILEE